VTAPARAAGPLALLVLLAACSAPAPSGGEAPRGYTVRGELVAPPSPVTAGTQLLVRHEAIPDFVDAAGKVVGMEAMVMPFDVAPAVLPKDLAVGDKVELRFTMDWKVPRLQVVRVERLPPGTPLRFGSERAPER
jgi:hypothetical protein